MDSRWERLWAGAAPRCALRALDSLTRCAARGRAEVQRAVGELFEALWPRVCWLCRAPVADGARPSGAHIGPEACTAHALTDHGLTGNRCERCARHLPHGIRDGERCRVCRARAPRFKRVLAAGEYAEPLSAWVLALKHGGRSDLARPLGRHLAACLAALCEPERAPRAMGLPRELGVCATEDGSQGGVPVRRRKAQQVPHSFTLFGSLLQRSGGVRGRRHVDSILGRRLLGPLLCPVPLHPLRRVERGYDQALLLARVLGDALDLPVATLLVRLRATTPQGTEGGRATRRSNVAGAFGLARTEFAGRVFGRGPLVGRDVWLVDDVFTSGATADACAEVLRRGGARSVTVVVLARAGALERDEPRAIALAQGAARHGGPAPPVEARGP